MLEARDTTDARREPMSKARLEAFTDGVIAVIITVLVLQLHAPPAPGWPAWQPLLLPLIIYAVGFQLVAAMWVLHHSVVVRLTHINRTMMYTNFVFLLFLSLFPLTVEALSLHPRDPANLAVFCADAFGCGVALSAFRIAALRDHGSDPEFVRWNRRRQRFGMALLTAVVAAAALGLVNTFAGLAVIATTLVLVLMYG